MARMIASCPVCGGALHVTELKCGGCGMALRNDFEMSAVETLTEEEREFMFAFLKKKGNLSALQSELGMSYPTAKRKLDELLVKLGLAEEEPARPAIDPTEPAADSAKASAIIRAKLTACGGGVRIQSLTGLPIAVRANADGRTFWSDKLPSVPFRYEIFDIVTDVLREQGGRARKGNGRNFRLGDPECDESTIVGAIGYRYWTTADGVGAEEGKAVYDPVFVLAAVMDWAGLVHNRRGYVELTADYRKRLAASEQ